ncbi:ElyC/SanA/YdcF family protein [Nocardioides hwasunensis]|uniref:YdcF family protein n=1 Tax=Nocardioides hwasunensis TaxID=397258 RepID=A0ABR8MJH1_9ACTN|nr:ElyC/SanA/YdcF family protein [Nocardioides hwasunensis]MBD3914239.1 YdcF family protein [Nocardioides hwasunensis]
MTGFSTSAVLAILLGALLVPVAFVPYVAWTYRRRGTLGFGHALIAVAAIVSALALWTFTILPLPDPSTISCSPGVRPQLVPLASLRDLELGRNGVRDPALLQLVLNVALFVPFGMLVRHLAPGVRARTVVALGFATSLLIELTQLTGVWGVYPCAYRLFDVDDLLTNTVGAVVGVALAPLLAKVPGQEVVPTDQPRRVTRARRLLGMAVDVVSVYLVTLLVLLPVTIAARRADWTSDRATFDRVDGATTLAVSVLLLLVVPLAARGVTLGQLSTFVRPIGPDGAPPPVISRLARWATGSGAYFVLAALGDLTGTELFSRLGTLLLAVSAAYVVLRHPRGLSGVASRTTLVDSRDRGTSTRALGVDPRSLGLAVVATVLTANVLVAGLAAVGAVAPRVSAVVYVVAGALLMAAAVAVVPYLLVNGVVVIRKEGLSVTTLLPLATGAAPVVVAGVLVLALALDLPWVAAAALGALVVLGYLGFLVVAFLGYGRWYARRPPRGRVDAVVVLGSRIFGDRVPPLLAARVDRGVEVLLDQLVDEVESAAVLVCSGGQGPDETMAEGTAMAAHAVDQGAPADRVLAETGSRTTQQNIVLSRDLLRARGIDGPMVVTTNDFHAFRAALVTRDAGVVAQVVGAPTAHYYFPAAALREFVALLARNPVAHLSVSLGLFLVSGATALLVLMR